MYEESILLLVYYNTHDAAEINNKNMIQSCEVQIHFGKKDVLKHTHNLTLRTAPTIGYWNIPESPYRRRALFELEVLKESFCRRTMVEDEGKGTFT